MRRFNFDLYLAIPAIILSAIGLTTLASVTPSLFGTQLFFAFIGLGLYLFFSNLDYRIFWSLGKLIYIGSLVALTSTLVFGYASHGATRWIQIGTFGLQFSEILKPFLVCSFAYFFVNLENSKAKLIIWLLLLAPVLGLIYKQPDLGGTIVYLFSFGLMLILSGIDWRALVGLFLSVVATLPFIWRFLATYQQKRIVNFINPEHDLLGTGYNAAQSVITVGSGMLLGSGLGRGTQSHLNFLPEFHTDFIFASLSEEFGFIGSVTVLIVTFVLLSRLAILLGRAQQRFPKIIITGYLGILFIQAFINIGMNIGVVPVTGITLPFVSYGGSSILASFTVLGIATNIAASESEI